MLDLQKEYTELTGAKNYYPLSVMVVRKEFAEKYPILLSTFLKEYQKASEWTVKHPQNAAKLVEKHSLGLSAGVVAKAIPASNYTYIPAAQAITDSEDLLKIFLNNNPASIGGKLPERDFYYEGETNR